MKFHMKFRLKPVISREISWESDEILWEISHQISHPIYNSELNYLWSDGGILNMKEPLAPLYPKSSPF